MDANERGSGPGPKPIRSESAFISVHLRLKSRGLMPGPSICSVGHAIRPVRPRAHGQECHPRRRHHAAVHRCECLPRFEGRPDLRDLDPGGRHLDGAAASRGKFQHSGKQHRPDYRLRRRHAGGHHLCAAGSHHGGLVAGLSLLDHGRGLRDRRHPGRDVLRAVAARAGDGLRPALPGGRRGGRGAEGRVRFRGGQGGERQGPAHDRCRFVGFRGLRTAGGDAPRGE